ncbi:polysaccharide biosynthesis protein CapD [Aliidongia dinghuensis]|uniref:Polysaccharide biosynthesis protein CapD n=1 Tax=Aliidongia dinghuensis TaxID=1867774 RepID=A0A8J3E7R8_9PROT|nr:nucleoside-diphosphate sugar epimerase/dehydratase [Aliidongia dinghuensis]GGF48336.1 polysaccharide biosynthesis protein CapD [Aliidongia dinghuensis]
MKRINRTFLALVHDALMTALSLLLSLYLRLGADMAALDRTMLLQDMALFTVIVLVFLRLTGLYRGIWRYASLNDLFAIGRAVTVAVLAYTLVLFLSTRLEGQPRSTLVINWFVLIGLLSGPRILYRLFKDGRLDRVFERDAHRRIPVLLVGAGDGAELFVNEMRRDRRSNYDPIGIIAVNEGRVGRTIHRVPVVGTIDQLTGAVEKLTETDRRPQRIILTNDMIDGALISRVVDQASALGIDIARMPRVSELKSGVGDGLEIRPIAIEDLLGRAQRVLDREAMAHLIRGRRVLVTGAGGTIGSELVRQIAALAPSHLTLVDSAEYQLYLIDLDLAENFATLPRTTSLGDVRDRHRLDEIMAEARPELVFHAAAYKHVPMVEANPTEGVLTNVIGTRNLAEACRTAGVAAMVMISTDKAVHPTNVMGASKRLAECICQALDLAGRAGGQKNATRFVTVRFGNVLGSTGSVVPLFRRQLQAGGPLTVTHKDVTRFFMTVREAVELVLQASAVAMSDHPPKGLERGGIFVLEMGESVKIADLARQMIRLAGLVPDRDIKIEYIGLRPGEKLYEELFHEAEPPVKTEADGILLAAPRTADYAVLSRALDEMDEAARGRDTARVLTLLSHLVPELQREAGQMALPAADAAR